MKAALNSSEGPRKKKTVGSSWAASSAVTKAGLRISCRGPLRMLCLSLESLCGVLEVGVPSS